MRDLANTKEGKKSEGVGRGKAPKQNEISKLGVGSSPRCGGLDGKKRGRRLWREGGGRVEFIGENHWSVHGFEHENLIHYLKIGSNLVVCGGDLA